MPTAPSCGRRSCGPSWKACSTKPATCSRRWTRARPMRSTSRWLDGRLPALRLALVAAALDRRRVARAERRPLAHQPQPTEAGTADRATLPGPEGQTRQSEETMLMLRARFADGASREFFFCAGSTETAEAAYHEALACKTEWLDSLMLFLLDGKGQVLCLHGNFKWINPDLL